MFQSRFGRLDKQEVMELLNKIFAGYTVEFDGEGAVLDISINDDGSIRIGAWEAGGMGYYSKRHTFKGSVDRSEPSRERYRRNDGDSRINSEGMVMDCGMDFSPHCNCRECRIDYESRQH